MAKLKVLISDALSPAAVKIFQDRGIEADVKTGLKPEELEAIIGDYDGLAIRSATKVTLKILAAAKKLKVVGRAGIGVDNIDIPAATAQGVVVMNTPFGNAITTAEHAIALMFALARQLPAANASTHAGKWEKNRFMGVEVTGKTLGIIGCGNIGSKVAERALGLKMKTIAFDPFLSPERAREIGVEKVELDRLFPRADFITLHTPLTDKTKGLIDAAALGKCKKGVYIINCARGGLVVEADLQAALESGQVAGAALDVFAEEPAKQHPLFGNEKIVCTPHLGASTNEAQENVALQVTEQISDFLLTGAVANALNMSSLSAEDAPKLRPYMKLAEQLGAFAGQITDHGIAAIDIEYQGEVTALRRDPITSTIVMGLLRPSLESVNRVNAPTVAKERGIRIVESTNSAAGDYHTLIRLKVGSAGALFTLAGSLFGGKPRIVAIDNVPVEVELTPHMLFVRNHDKPGALGQLTTALGEAGINIANLTLGRTAPGADALSLISVDGPVPDSVRAEIKAIANIVSVHALKFGSNGGA